MGETLPPGSDWLALDAWFSRGSLLTPVLEPPPVDDLFLPRHVLGQFVDFLQGLSVRTAVLSGEGAAVIGGRVTPPSMRGGRGPAEPQTSTRMVSPEIDLSTRVLVVPRLAREDDASELEPRPRDDISERDGTSARDNARSVRDEARSARDARDDRRKDAQPDRAESAPHRASGRIAPSTAMEDATSGKARERALEPEAPRVREETAVPRPSTATLEPRPSLLMDPGAMGAFVPVVDPELAARRSGAREGTTKDRALEEARLASRLRSRATPEPGTEGQTPPLPNQARIPPERPTDRPPLPPRPVVSPGAQDSERPLETAPLVRTSGLEDTGIETSSGPDSRSTLSTRETPGPRPGASLERASSERPDRRPTLTGPTTPPIGPEVVAPLEDRTGPPSPPSTGFPLAATDTRRDAEVSGRERPEPPGSSFARDETGVLGPGSVEQRAPEDVPKPRRTGVSEAASIAPTDRDRAREPQSPGLEALRPDASLEARTPGEAPKTPVRELPPVTVAEGPETPLTPALLASLPLVPSLLQDDVGGTDRQPPETLPEAHKSRPAADREQAWTAPTAPRSEPVASETRPPATAPIPQAAPPTGLTSPSVTPRPGALEPTSDALSTALPIKAPLPLVAPVVIDAPPGGEDASALTGPSTGKALVKPTGTTAAQDAATSSGPPERPPVVPWTPARPERTATSDALGSLSDAERDAAGIRVGMHRRLEPGTTPLPSVAPLDMEASGTLSDQGTLPLVAGRTEQEGRNDAETDVSRGPLDDLPRDAARTRPARVRDDEGSRSSRVSSRTPLVAPVVSRTETGRDETEEGREPGPQRETIPNRDRGSSLPTPPMRTTPAVVTVAVDDTVGTLVEALETLESVTPLDMPVVEPGSTPEQAKLEPDEVRRALSKELKGARGRSSSAPVVVKPESTGTVGSTEPSSGRKRALSAPVPSEQPEEDSDQGGLPVVVLPLEPEEAPTPEEGPRVDASPRKGSTPTSEQGPGSRPRSSGKPPPQVVTPPEKDDSSFDEDTEEALSEVGLQDDPQARKRARLMRDLFTPEELVGLQQELEGLSSRRRLARFEEAIQSRKRKRGASINIDAPDSVSRTEHRNAIRFLEDLLRENDVPTETSDEDEKEEKGEKGGGRIDRNELEAVALELRWRIRQQERWEMEAR